VSRLAENLNARFKNSFLLGAALCEVTCGDKKALLVKPAAYMNNTGVVVKKVLARFKADLSKVLVVYDDVDLNLGQLRFKTGGSAGGQRGMASVINVLQTESLNRLRFGIDRPANGIDTADYVLSEFTRGEMEVAVKTVSLAAQACEDWIKFGGEYVMQNYNRTLV